MNYQVLDDKQAKQNVLVLIAAQAILGAQLPIIFVVGGLAGGQLAGNVCFATLPISLIVFGSMTTAPWLSRFMHAYGRQAGFFLGTFSGAVGAASSAYGLFISSFTVFLVGSYLSGIYMTTQGFYRFAATDTASEKFRPKAISYVMAGGLLSAVLGPQLNKIVQDLSVITFLGSYIAIVALNLVGIFLLFLLRLPKQSSNVASNANLKPERSKLDLLRDPKILVAIICGMIAYSLMNLVMTSTPLAVVGCGFTKDNANDIVSVHVIAMYLPAFFTGHLIVKFGVGKIMGLGLIILAGAGIVALNGFGLLNFFGALILLGIGWNFGFIGATTMLASSYTENERGKAQGMNDFFVFGFVTLASLASGSLMNCSANTPADGWTSVNLAMIPFLILAGCSLIWLSKKDLEKI